MPYYYTECIVIKLLHQWINQCIRMCTNNSALSSTVNYTATFYKYKCQNLLWSLTKPYYSLGILHRELIWNMLRLPRSNLTTPSNPSMLSKCPVNSRSSPTITFTFTIHNPWLYNTADIDMYSAHTHNCTANGEVYHKWPEMWISTGHKTQWRK